MLINIESGSEDGENELKKDKASTLDKRHASSRTMSTRRVCWHRNTSVSTVEYSIAVRVCKITSIVSGTQVPLKPLKVGDGFLVDIVSITG